MSIFEELFERSRKAEEKISQIIGFEEDIEQKEEAESAELEKASSIAQRLQNQHVQNSNELLEEELSDFVEAVEIFKVISSELHNMANDMHSVIDVVGQNAKQEKALVNRLARDEIQVTSSEKVEELAQTITGTHQNIERLVEESETAKNEAQNAQAELEKLLQLDALIHRVEDGNHSIDRPEKELQAAKENLKDAEWKLGEIPDKLEYAKEESQNAVNSVRNNIDEDRRKFVKKAGISAAAITGLAGCSAPTAENSSPETPQYSKNRKEKLMKADPNQQNYGSSKDARNFTVEDAETRVIATNDTEHVIEVVSVQAKEAVIRIDGSLGRVKEGDVVNLSGEGLEIDSLFRMKADQGIIKFKIVDKSQVNKGWSQAVSKAVPSDRYFVLSTGEELTFHYNPREYVIELKTIQQDVAVVKINGSLKKLEEGQDLQLSDGGSITLKHIFRTDENRGKVKFVF